MYMPEEESREDAPQLEFSSNYDFQIHKHGTRDVESGSHSGKAITGPLATQQ